MSNKKILNTACLARYLGLSKATLYAMIKDGRFSVKPIQGTDPKLWSASNVDEWIDTPKGEISDGYHTFNELYEHRHMLFANIVNRSPEAWKSKLHDDDTMFEGWFIAGLPTTKGDVTYHLPLKYWNIFKCEELDKAPKWDGHTSDDVVDRLKVHAVPDGEYK